MQNTTLNHNTKTVINSFDFFEMDNNLAIDSVSTGKTTDTNTSVSTTNNIVADNTVKLLTTLEKSCTTWEQGVYKKSNDALYALLAECLVFCGNLDGKQNKKRNTGLIEFYKTRNYKYNENVTLANRVVKAVFGDIHRSRISTYSLVVDQAKKAKVNPTNLPAWIEQQGGIQAVKIAKSVSFVSTPVKISIAQEDVGNKKALANVKGKALAELADAEYIGMDCILLATQNADGSFDIKALTRKKAALNATFEALYADKANIEKQAQK